MGNRLKEMGETASWRLMVNAALEGARSQGYDLRRQPGRGLSNTYQASKDGKVHVVSVRTTRNRWMAFPPLEKGTRWKTLGDVELVLVSAADDNENPQNVDVYLFPADEVRRRFDAAYAARLKAGHKLPDNYGMWVLLDAGNPAVTNQVGSGLAEKYPRIARFSIDELEANGPVLAAGADDEAAAEVEVEGEPNAGTVLNTVADVLAFARSKIAELTGMPVNAIKLDLKMGV